MSPDLGDSSFEFEVSDPGSKSSATLTLRGRLSPQLLKRYLAWFQEKFTEMPMSEDENSELQELTSENPDLLDQRKYERLRTLEQKKKSIDKKQSALLPSATSDEEPQFQPVRGETFIEKPEESIEGLSERGQMLVRKNPDMLSQKEWEELRSEQEAKKRKPRGGGMFSTTWRRSGVLGK